MYVHVCTCSHCPTVMLHVQCTYSFPCSRDKTPEPDPLFTESTSTKSKDLFSDEYVHVYILILIHIRAPLVTVGHQGTL